MAPKALESYRSAMAAVDFAYLENFAANDAEVIRDVLVLFREQAQIWAPKLTADSPGWRDVVHTVKGAARGVGANALGDACEKAEFGAESDLPAVVAALDEAVAEITAYQAARA